MKLPFVTADVFTDEMFGGNPLAVIPDAGGLSSAVMQSIAKEFNLSETTFVLPPKNPAHHFQVRIFTPSSELAFAGHPTVGTAVALATLGKIPLTAAETTVVFEEGVGPVPVRIFARDGVPTGAQFTAARVPEEFGKMPPREVLAAALSLPPDAVAPGRQRAMGLSCGTPFAMVPLRDPAAVAAARFDGAVWQRQRITGVAGVYVFAHMPDGAAVQVHAREFAPWLGIIEDPATGSAAAALAGWLVEHEKPSDGTRTWTIRQGVEMGRPSRVLLEADVAGGAITAVRVGGAAIMVSEGALSLRAKELP